MQKRIVAIGECMVELAPQGAPDTFSMGFAGDTFNTAWYLRRAVPEDWSVDYFTAVGTDAVSDRMLQFMNEARLGTTHIARIADRTVGLYMIELQNGERSFSYWRSHSAARQLAADPQRLAAALNGATLAYFSGITLAILEPQDREALISALSGAQAAGTLVAFDPNLRPRLWPDIGTMCASVMKAAAVADIVLPSYDDEANFFGDATPEATARRYAEAGCGLSVVKNGAGAMLALSKALLESHMPNKADEVVDTTAAGDSFNAGFLAAYLAGGSLADAMSAGAATAVRVIGKRGALVHI